MHGWTRIASRGRREHNCQDLLRGNGEEEDEEEGMGEGYRLDTSIAQTNITLSTTSYQHASSLSEDDDCAFRYYFIMTCRQLACACPIPLET